MPARDIVQAAQGRVSRLEHPVPIAKHAIIRPDRDDLADEELIAALNGWLGDRSADQPGGTTGNEGQVIFRHLEEFHAGPAKLVGLVVPAAMLFYQRGLMDAETLEVYRICSRLDAEDPATVLRRYRIGSEWLVQLENNGAS